MTRTSDFRIGDEVQLIDPTPDERGFTGTIVLIENVGTIPGEEVFWLDMHPGALGYYSWVLAHFPDSWHPGGAVVHAVNKFPASRCRKVVIDDETP